MKNQNLYYTPPTDKTFDEVKATAIKLWHDVDSDRDLYGYASSKTERIQNLKNIDDNLMYIVAMFDDNNRKILAKRLTNEALAEVSERLIAGGTPARYNPFKQ